jgi:hypothetical protein
LRASRRASMLRSSASGRARVRGKDCVHLMKWMPGLENKTRPANEAEMISLPE